MAAHIIELVGEDRPYSCFLAEDYLWPLRISTPRWFDNGYPPRWLPWRVSRRLEPALVRFRQFTWDKRIVRMRRISL